MAEIARLGIVVEADGAIRVLRQTSGELARLDAAGARTAESFGAVGKRLEHFGTRSAFVLSSLAQSGARDLGGMLHAFANLGFAAGAAGGIVAIGLGLIAEAWQETRKKAKEEQDKMEADMLQWTKSLKGKAADVELKGLLERRKQLEGEIGGSDFSFWGNFKLGFREMFGLADPALAEIAKIDARIKALGGTTADAARDMGQTLNEAFRKTAASLDLQLLTAKMRAAVTGGTDLTVPSGAGFRTYSTGTSIFTSATERTRVLAVAIAVAEKEAAAVELARKLNVEKTITQQQYDQEIIRLNEVLKKKKEIAAEEKKTSDAAAKRNYWLGAGLGLLGAAGPMGGILAGGIQGGIAGSVAGPFGIAFGAINGLVGGILSLAHTARDAARALKDWETAEKLAVGDLTQQQVDAQKIQENYAQRRRDIAAAEALAAQELFKGHLSPSQYQHVMDDYKKQLDELNDREKRRLAGLSKEADEIERINNAVRNAPSGFYVEKYLRRIGAGSSSTLSGGWESGSGVTLTGLPTGGSKSGVTSVKVETININGNRDGKTMVKEFLSALDEHVASTGGVGTSRSDALESM